MGKHVKTSRTVSHIGRWGSLLLLASLLCLGLGAASAQAESVPSFNKSFTGGETPAASFGTLGGVAVDETSGDVYVLDATNEAIDKFSETGTFICQITGNGSGANECDAGTPGPEAFSFSAPEPGESPGAIAVDNSTTDGHQGYLYVTDRGHDAVDVFTSTGAYVGRLSGEETAFSEPSGVAVDGSGNIYVVNGAEGANTIAEFNASRVFQAPEYASGFSGTSNAIAVNSAGTVYVTATNGNMKEIKSIRTEPSGNIIDGTVTDLTVAPATGNLYVLEEGERVVIYEPYEPESLSEVGPFGNKGEIEAGAAVAVNGSNHDAYVAENASSGSVVAIYIYAPSSTPPSVSSISPASGATTGGTSMTITGSEFAAGANVEIGGVAATEVEVLSPTEIKAETAASAPGRHEVVVSDANGPSTGGPSYTYVLIPSFLDSFTGSETPAESFDGVSGVAVDESSGDVYVLDVGHETIDKFSETGTFICQISGDGSGEKECDAGTHGPEAFSFSEGSGVAVDNSTTDGHQGYLYVADRGHNAVDIFNNAGAYVGRLSGETTPFDEPAGVAVDGSGNVYVMSGAVEGAGNVIDEFNSSGVFQEEYSDGFGYQTASIAVNATGTVYVISSGGHVKELKNKGSEQTEIYSGPSAVAVEPLSGDLYFALNGGGAIGLFYPEPVEEVGGSGKGQFGKGGVIASAVAFVDNATNHAVYVSDHSSGGGRVDVFGVGPTCKTEAPATMVSPTSFTAPGTIEPHGTPTTYYFQYGLTTTPYELFTGPAGPVSSTSSVTGALTGLAQPHQTYRYEMVIHYGATELACEPDETLTTPSAPPSLDGQSVTGVGQTGATLEAQINPNNEQTHYYFESSTSPSLSSGVTVTPALPGATIASAYGDRTVSQQLSSLQPDTTYYYRAVAENEAASHGGSTSKSEGTIESLLTYPATPSTGAVSAVTEHAATIAGSFNPGGHDTRYYFEYSSTSGGGSTPIVDAGSGTSTVAVEAALSSLTPLTTYHYQLVVANEGGVSVGASGEFATLPQAPNVITSSVTNVDASSATLTGSLDPEGAAASYRFQYGTTTAYGAETPVTAGETDALESRQYVTAEISGLQPSTLYHYRLTATNGGGEATGEDGTFTTNAAGEPNLSPLPPGFTLTGAAPSGPAATIYPSLTSLGPLPPAKTSTTVTPKPLTKAQKLNKALKACRKEAKKSRAKCEKSAKAKYGSKAKKKKKTKRRKRRRKRNRTFIQLERPQDPRAALKVGPAYAALPSLYARLQSRQGAAARPLELRRPPLPSSHGTRTNGSWRLPLYKPWTRPFPLFPAGVRDGVTQRSHALDAKWAPRCRRPLRRGPSGRSPSPGRCLRETEWARPTASSPRRRLSA